jgi:hypothetical protein
LNYELPEVIQGLVLRLEKLEKDQDEEKAKITYRTLYRLIYSDKSGRPKYPQFSWESAKALIEMHKDP